MGDRPLEVAEDWINVDCANPRCPNMVWVPPSQLNPPPSIVNVCSAECAMALTTALG